MFGMPKTLIVVYKDEMLMNQLKKLVETNDDSESGDIVGTTDDSINIVSWTEKVWLGNKKAGNIKDKVLFLGEIKGTDKLIPVIDVIFDDCGVKFGWAGNQAILYSEIKALNDRDAYISFLRKLAKLSIPEMIKKPQNIKIDAQNVEKNEITTESVEEKETKKGSAFLRKAKKALATGAETVGKAGSIVVDKASDVFRDRNAVKRQQLFYGIVNLYNNGLEQFMNM